MRPLRNILMLVLGIVVGVALVVVALIAIPGAGLTIPIARAAQPAQVVPAPAVPPPPTAVPPAAAPTTPPTTPPAPIVAPAAPAASGSSGGRLLADEQTLVDVYERVSPAVVNITNRRTAPGSGGFPATGAGSGVVFDGRGYVLTNNHVVDDASRLEVALADGTNVPGELVGRDPGNDLAVVKIDVPKEKLHAATLGDSDALKPGQLAIAIGSPFGLDRTITTGVISSVGRTRSNEGRRPIRNMIQTDAAVNPGNSGGPLLNSSGEVVGINTAIESPVRGSVGIGFAVPINTAKLFLPQMLAGGKVTHPWLGISGLALTPATAKDLGLNVTQGVYVTETVSDGPAQKAGIHAASSRGSSSGDLPKGGDIMLSIDGRPVVKTDDISNYLDTKQAGDLVKVEIMRDGQPQTLDVTLGEWPDTAAPRGAPRGNPDFELPDPPSVPGFPRLPLPGR